MLEQILKLVEESGQQAIVQNKGVPDQMNNAVIREISGQIFAVIKGNATRGNLQQIVNMFQGGSKNLQSDPLVAAIINSVTTSVNSKFGIPSPVAQSMASDVVPSVITKVINKTNDPKDIDFDLQQMMRSMTGNRDLDISSMVQANGVPKGVIGNIGSALGKLFGR